MSEQVNSFNIGDRVVVARTYLHGEVLEIISERYCKVRVNGGAVMNFDNSELSHVKASMPATVPAIVPMNGKPVVKYHKRRTHKRGQITLPLGGDKPTAAVQGTLESNEATEALSQRIGMNPSTYRFIRKLLLLKNNPTLSTDHRATIDKALESIDTTLELKPAIGLTLDIMKQHWTVYTQGGKTRSQRSQEARQRETLDNVIFRVRELCDSTEELKCPPLEIEARLEAVKSLGSSIAALSALLIKLTHQGDSNG